MTRSNQKASRDMNAARLAGSNNLTRSQIHRNPTRLPFILVMGCIQIRESISDLEITQSALVTSSSGQPKISQCRYYDQRILRPTFACRCCISSPPIDAKLGIPICHIRPVQGGVEKVQWRDHWFFGTVSTDTCNARSIIQKSWYKA